MSGDVSRRRGFEPSRPLFEDLRWRLDEVALTLVPRESVIPRARRQDVSNRGRASYLVVRQPAAIEIATSTEIGVRRPSVDATYGLRRGVRKFVLARIEIDVIPPMNAPVSASHVELPQSSCHRRACQSAVDDALTSRSYASVGPGGK